MLKFMNLGSDELVSRVDVLRAISTHVKEKNLQFPDRRTSFKVDRKLKSLFPTDKELKYTQIMGKISQFFPTKNSATSSTSSSENSVST